MDSNQNLLMDIDNMDFVNSFDDSYEKLQTNHDDIQNSSFEADQSYDRDIVTGELVMKLTAKDDLPLIKGENAKLKFKLGPLSSQNIAYLSDKTNTKLYPTKLPEVDISKQYSHYVSKLFEIYDNLGESRIYSVPTIGVINSSYEKEHTAAVNYALEAIATELELFIESIKDKNNAISRFLELEESLTIINCLKLIYFTIDSPDESDVRSSFVSGLLNWVNRSDGEPNEDYIEQVFGMDSQHKVYETPNFWILLNQLLLRGLFDQALGCIERSKLLEYLEDTCEVSANSLKDMIEMVKRYPLDSVDTFREWKALTLEVAQTFLNSETKISGDLRDNLEDTLLLFSGDQKKIIRYSKTWYESFCGLLLYYIPSLELSTEYLQLSLDANPLDTTNNWEEACVNIIKGNVYAILPVIESLDTCTASFSAAIIEAKGLIDNYFEDDMRYSDDYDLNGLFSQKNGMACYMLNNFAFELCTSEDKDLWPVAIGLITLSPTVSPNTKKLAISELLQHYPFKTNDDIEWMLSVCAKWKLPEVARSLYTILGSSMMYEGKTIEAMTNFSKAGKFDLVKEYSWTLFEASAMKGEPLDDMILNAIVDDMGGSLISPEILDNLVTSAMRQTLSPYAVLYKFFQAQSNCNWEEALQLLVALLQFEFLPNYYLVMLVSKFLYPIFLVDDSKLVDEDSVLVIIDALEQKWDSEDAKSINIYEAIVEESNEESKKILPNNLKDLIKLVRKSLSLKLCQEFM